jgi:hypothetical protein
MPAYRFGKHPPKSDYRTLQFRDYATFALAAPPASVNRTVYVRIPSLTLIRR